MCYVRTEIFIIPGVNGKKNEEKKFEKIRIFDFSARITVRRNDWNEKKISLTLDDETEPFSPISIQVENILFEIKFVIFFN